MGVYLPELYPCPARATRRRAHLPFKKECDVHVDVLVYFESGVCNLRVFKARGSDAVVRLVDVVCYFWQGEGHADPGVFLPEKSYTCVG